MSDETKLILQWYAWMSPLLLAELGGAAYLLATSRLLHRARRAGWALLAAATTLATLRLSYLTFEGRSLTGYQWVWLRAATQTFVAAVQALTIFLLLYAALSPTDAGNDVEGV